MNRIQPILISCLVAVLLGTSVAQAQRYIVSDTSELWLSGTSSVNSFECEAETLRFDYDVDHDIEGSGFVIPGVSLVVPVHDLDCHNRRMNRDLQKALQADTYPEIRLDVFRMDLVPEAADAGMPDSPQVAFHGVMTLAGVSRDVRILVTGWIDETRRLHGEGTLDVKMTDFNVEPPTALFGLVKAHDDISIRFHLMANMASDSSDSPSGYGSLSVLRTSMESVAPSRLETVGKSSEH